MRATILGPIISGNVHTYGSPNYAAERTGFSKTLELNALRMK